MIPPNENPPKPIPDLTMEEISVEPVDADPASPPEQSQSRSGARTGIAGAGANQKKPTGSKRRRPAKQHILIRLVRRFFWVVVLVLVLVDVLFVSTRDLHPMFNWELPESEQFTPSGEVYVDKGGSFADYIVNVRAHLERWRVPIEHESLSEKIQIDWVAPYTHKVAAKCRSVRARALLIHGLFGSAYQMADIADHLAKKCIESDVMLLPGHGTRAADLNLVSASDYYTAVLTRMNEFQRGCSNCVVVGFSLGGLLATLALMENSKGIHGLVFLAPAWSFTAFETVEPLIEPFQEIFKYSPFSRKQMLPTHYSYESTYAFRQLADMIIWLQNKTRSGRKLLDIPTMLVASADDQAVPLQPILDASNYIFTHPPELLIYSPTPDFWSSYLANFGNKVRSENSQWPQAGVESLSHFGLVYSPFNILYGYSGIFGKCMEPSGFSCQNPPTDPVYGARALNPEADYALAGSHPEFDRMMSFIQEFIDKNSYIER